MKRLGNLYSRTRERVSRKSCHVITSRSGNNVIVCDNLTIEQQPTSAVSVGNPHMMSVAMVTPGTLQEVYIQDSHRYLINPQILSSVRKLRDTSSVGFD